MDRCRRIMIKSMPRRILANSWYVFHCGLPPTFGILLRVLCLQHSAVTLQCSISVSDPFPSRLVLVLLSHVLIPWAIVLGHLLIIISLINQEALKLPPCYLAGLSMGTIIAIQVAVSYPDIVKGLILFSPLGTEEVCSAVTDLAPIYIFPIADAGPFPHFVA